MPFWGYVQKRIMKTWNLLLLLLCSRLTAGRGQDEGLLPCKPQNLNLTGSGQKLELRWEDGPSCSSMTDAFIYELRVLVADKQMHYDEGTLMPDQTERIHTWTWTLPLYCGPHSVRLTYRYNNTSSWAEQTLIGRPVSKTEVFPKDKLFEVGSSATFCCVVPPGESFVNMTFDDYSGSSISRISNQTYVMTVLLKEALDGCIDVKCETSKTQAGTCTFINYPPADRDLQCETQDLESVECQWSLGRNDYWYHHNPMEYHLLGREEACLSFSTPHSRLTGRCSQKVQVDAGEKNWTVTAQNKLGKVTLYDPADLSKRVRMFAPEAVTVVNVNARNATLQWRWGVKRYYHMSTKCQIHLNFSNTVSEVFGFGLNWTLLTNLIPNASYGVKIRCGTTQHFWKWGDWSKVVDFHTKTDVPEALNVWMQRNNNKTWIVWKIPPANQSGGEILDYTVGLTKASGRGHQNTTTVPRRDNFLQFTLDPLQEQYTCETHQRSVQMRNLICVAQSSSPATITISTPDETQMKTSRIRGSNGAFSVSWRDSPEASCGYIVDWYPVERPWSVDWLKLPPNQTSANITNLTDGCRYFLSVYACTQGSPVLLEKREGYATETKIEKKLFKLLKHEQKNLDMEVSWDPIPLRQQTAYIQGYSLYCWNSNNHVVNVSTADPEATRLTARSLKVDSYQFVLTAHTAGGECCKETFSVTLNSPTDKMPWLVLSSLGALFLFLLFVTIICYKQWRCIKKSIFPPIPKPVLVNKWMTSPDSLQSPHLLRAQIHPIDIPQLCKKPKAAVPERATQDGRHWTFSQSPKGYTNQPLQMFTPSHLRADSTTINAPSSSFRGNVQNPSYDLKVWSEDQNSSSEYPLLDPSPPGQYKPQACMEIFRPDPVREGSMKCIPCNSAYISFPR
ncbi:hypothetical protein OJAV_G00116850 [Oryzias javanicus]|uniref:Fibronectin type-III domain-containing protein n=1 Tax=Oryzias javanicus TaxID=123683 RepID=A0A3S2PFJ3_ORYJA|nr:hypothetical protein OJAV_G00116850 [Oryzias javanicus]